MIKQKSNYQFEDNFSRIGNIFYAKKDKIRIRILELQLFRLPYLLESQVEF